MPCCRELGCRYHTVTTCRQKHNTVRSFSSPLYIHTAQRLRVSMHHAVLLAWCLPCPHAITTRSMPPNIFEVRTFVSQLVVPQPCCLLPTLHAVRYIYVRHTSPSFSFCFVCDMTRKQKYSIPLRVKHSNGPDRRYAAAMMTTKFHVPDKRSAKHTVAQRHATATALATAAAAIAAIPVVANGVKKLP